MHSGLAVILVVVAAIAPTLGSGVLSPSQKLEAAGFKYLGTSVSNARSQMKLYVSARGHQLAFDPAYKYCSDVEGRLVSIENHDQRAIINTELMGLAYPPVWTSAAYDPSRTWIWLSNGVIMSYQLWFNNEVPAAPTGNDCGYFQGGRFQNGLKSFDCSTPFQFICEVPV